MKAPCTVLASRLREFLSACVLLLLPLGVLFGQETAQPAKKPDVDPSLLTLSPLEVRGDSDKSYGALNSNSITRFNTSLQEMPVSADIFNEAFMTDIAAESVEDVIKNYSAGGGYVSSDPTSEAGSNGQAGDRPSTSAVTVRGLMAPTLRRDGFIQLGSLTNPGSTGTGVSTNFDIERIEVIEGPQSLLYGSGGAAGVVNTISKRAYFNKTLSGSVTFGIDSYDHMRGVIDFGVGNARFAVRGALIKEEIGGRRDIIGGPLEGYYLQLAAKIFGNTTVRLTTEQTSFDRLYNGTATLSTGSSANDSRNNQNMRYLVISDQVQASASGPSGAGAILGGTLDWVNADSLLGWQRREKSDNQFTILTVETQWNRWLTTEFSAGYNAFENYLHSNSSGAILSPNNPGNPLKEWAGAMTNSSVYYKPTWTTALRYAAVAKHRLFGPRDNAQTMFGVDYNHSEQPTIEKFLYRADADGNIIGTGASRTKMPTQYWSLANGPVEKPLFDPFTSRVTIDGVNYVQAIGNIPNPAAVTPDNPLGLIRGSADTYQINEAESFGVYGVNVSKWMDEKLTALVGLRYDDSTYQRQFQGTTPTSPTVLDSGATALNYNFGLNYALTEGLNPYVAVSSSYHPPLETGTDPNGVIIKTAHAVGGEVGVKVQNRAQTLSGSVAAYWVDAENEETRIANGNLETINPTGLNGKYGAASNWLNVDRETRGIQASFTYNPTKNWRMRWVGAWTDATTSTDAEYDQLYNDQFYANSIGQVTYADGSLVYVPATPSATTPAVGASTLGAVPLTVAMMSSPTSVYYANPLAVSGAIDTTSAVARVLRVNDPVHGRVLTGVAGLPISSIQINPGFTPPGSIVVSRAGDVASGFPEFGMNLTSIYEVDRGWARGFRFGGTVTLNWNNRGFYYFPAGPGGANPVRELFVLPDTRRLDLIFAYSRTFRKVGFTVQLNIRNALDRYEELVIPNPVSGWAGPNQGIFSEEPREYVVSTTLKF